MICKAKSFVVSFGLLLLLPVEAKPQAQTYLPLQACAGSWIGNLPFGPPGSPALIGMFTYTPMDPHGWRLLVWGDPVNPLRNPGDPRLFPGTTSVGSSTGIATRVGPDSYRVRWIGYATKAPAATGPTSWFRAEIQQIYIQETTIECRGDTLVEKGSFYVYSAIDDSSIVVPGLVNGVRDQDKNKDGLPDDGEKPILSFPFEWTLKRFN